MFDLTKKSDCDIMRSVHSCGYFKIQTGGKPDEKDYLQG